MSKRERVYVTRIRTTAPVVRIRAVVRERVGNPRHDRLTVVQLDANECRWPITNSPPYLFCGRETRGVYCDYHHGRAIDKPALPNRTRDDHEY